MCQGFFHTDMFNIEEILSLLEMESSLDEQTGDVERRRKNFANFIIDVIKAYTPAGFIPAGGHWIREQFGDTLLSRYSVFVASLLGVGFSDTTTPRTPTSFVIAYCRLRRSPDHMNTRSSASIMTWSSRTQRST